MRTSQNKGALLVLVLVFGTVFFMIIAAFMGFVVTQSRQQIATVEKEQALAIAEAGLNYAKWYLAHYPDDTSFGTTTVPVVMPYEDSETGVVGTFTLSVASTTYCGEVSSIDIHSTGATAKAPQRTRTVYGKYARPTVAEYAYIINSNVWAGDDRVITGPYHSNGVIRMDGTNNSTVTSGQASWVCDGSLPCEPQHTGSTVNGVYGDGANSALWQFPAPPINFTGLTLDLSAMQSKARYGGGVYIAPSQQQGYLLRFLANGTFDLYKVKSKENEPQGNAYGHEMNKIKNAQYLANYTIPTSCPLVFVEDDVWVEGDVHGKVSLAAADLDTTGVDPTMILQGDINYYTATSGLLAVAEKDVLVGFDVPDNMTVNGIFIAQNGHFGRNYYSQYSHWPSNWSQYVLRNSLTINGSIVSNGSVGTKWVCTDWWGNATYCSGFNTRYNSYDRALVTDPPPLTPKTSDDYKFLEWREDD